jgi:hypothetical protein
MQMNIIVKIGSLLHPYFPLPVVVLAVVPLAP